MGLRVRKSIKLGKFGRINLSKSGVSLSAGVKGARVSINNKGVVRKSVGIPGTGIYYSDQHKITTNKRNIAPVTSKKFSLIPVVIISLIFGACGLVNVGAFVLIGGTVLNLIINRKSRMRV